MSFIILDYVIPHKNKQLLEKHLMPKFHTTNN